MHQRALTVGLFGAILPWLSGCTFDPFCLNCPTDQPDGSLDSGGPHDGLADGGSSEGGADRDATSPCDPNAEEVCNGLDDNCDGQIDEGIDLQTDPLNCGACSHSCAAENSFTDCVEGQCVVTGCDVCWHDRNTLASDGCEYGCCRTPSPTFETYCEPGTDGSLDCCDGLDNDCDGVPDENHDVSSDPHNCGGCAATCESGQPCPYLCNYAFAAGQCVEGECQMGDCLSGHWDADDDPGNGCEYACNQTNGGVEICDGLDNDCDNELDEDFPTMGQACGVDTPPCQQGHWACQNGHEVCDGAVNPSTEVCDNIDNDCDTQIDETELPNRMQILDPVTSAPLGFVGDDCGTDQGICSRGTWACIEGAGVCQPQNGSQDPTFPPTDQELCNGLDDNCDGFADEDVVFEETSCCDDPAGCCTRGAWQCLGGSPVCVGATYSRIETCNGVDDDCDGEVDEAANGARLTENCVSLCGAGERTCDATPNSNLAHWTDCTAGEPTDEICNGEDDDCDGFTDEADDNTPLTEPCEVFGCGGVRTCVNGNYRETCEVSITAETCNGVDDDCDGMIDERDASGNPLTRPCGTEFCRGVETCVSPAPGLVQWDNCTARVPDTEVCDGTDNDCDGLVDEADNLGTPLSQSCVYSTSCSGTRHCQGASGYGDCEVEIDLELCDGQDNDCDPATLDGADEPWFGTRCDGDDSDRCEEGTWQCVNRGRVCSDTTGSTRESCNNSDDDCDGQVDESLTRSCDTACGPGTETCAFGTWVGCTAPVPGVEVCNGRDDDCVGGIDNGFNLTSDPLNCGECDRSCYELLPNALVRCVPDTNNQGVCEVVGCEQGFLDCTNAPGCETSCVFSGVEICNDQDDDCDCDVDEADSDWSPPSCGSEGVCAGVESQCSDENGDGSREWNCAHLTSNPFYEPTEVSCDDEDNDCDGLVDEGFNVGVSCSRGQGICHVNGTIGCDPNDASSTVCNVPREPDTLIEDETCDGRDEDCDGVVDNLAIDDIATVNIAGRNVDLDGDGDSQGQEQGFSFRMFQFEASHPDATDADAGSIWNWACATRDVLPFTGVSWRGAQAACCGLNYRTGLTSDPANPTACLYQQANVVGGPFGAQMWIPRGWGLCLAGLWEASCQSAPQSSTDPYAAGAPWLYPYGNTYANDPNSFHPTACNGAEVDPDRVGLTGRNTCLGGATFAQNGLNHFDMSGNVHEWTFSGHYACPCDRLPDRCDVSGCGCDPRCVSCTCDTDASLRGRGSRCQYDSVTHTRCKCDPDCNTYYEYRGGSYNSVERAMTCQWDYNLGADQSDDPDLTGPNEPAAGLVLDTLGFRCCYYPQL